MLKKRITLSWPLAFSVTVISAISWSSIYQLLDAPSSQERLHFFLSSGAYSSHFETDLLSEFRDAGIKEISVTSIIPSNTFYASTLATVGIQECDVLILPQSVMEGLTDYSDFAPLQAPTLQNYGIESTDFTFLTSAGIPLGIQVYDGDQEKNILDGWLSFADQEDYFAFINVNTVNSGSFSTQEGTHTDHAFLALAYLLNHSPAQ